MTCDIPAEDIDRVAQTHLRYTSRLWNAIANVHLRKLTELEFKGFLTS